jgi:membrane fusion protein (multidrug efflux system)
MSTSYSLFARSPRACHALRHLPAALGCSAALLAACGPSQPPASAGGPPGGAMPPMPVTVRSVKLQTVPVLVDAVGQAEGSKEVEVRARVGGLIERQLYTEGDRVRAGAPLFAIERAPYEIAVATTKAALAQEQAKLEQAQREARRLKPLAEMQAISQREADDASTAQRSAEASVAAAQARVRDAELNLSYTAVSAPIAGVSGRAEKSQGSLVSAADGLLTKIVQTDPIWVRFSFSESELAQLKAGQGAAAVRLLGTDGQPLGVGGKLNFTGSSVDARLGTVGLRAAFANPELAVLPGQFVKAQVQVGQQKAWLVPQAAVVSGEQGKMVWTVQGGKAAPTPVEVGGWIGPDWAVLKGLKDGDLVVTDNLIKMRPGAAVAPKDAPSAPPAAGASGASAASAPTPAASR